MGAQTSPQTQNGSDSTHTHNGTASTLSSTAPTFRRMTKSRYHMENVIRFRQCCLQDPFQRPYTVRRLGQPNGKCWNPSDPGRCTKCTAVVRFRANWPISILSYGFFGPHGGVSSSGGKYHMEIEVLTEEFLSIAKTNQITPHINPGEEFHVRFDYPVPILPCTWYYAKFSLMVSPAQAI